MDSIVSQLRESYRRVVFAHKAHEKASELLHFRLRIIENTQVLLSALSIAGIITIFLGGNQLMLLLPALCCSVLFCLQVFFKKHDLGSIAEKHTEISHDLWEIQETYLSLLTDIDDGKLSREQIEMERDRLYHDFAAHLKCGIKLPEKACRKAKRSLQERDNLSPSDISGDSLLPLYLQKKSAS